VSSVLQTDASAVTEKKGPQLNKPGLYILKTRYQQIYICKPTENLNPFSPDNSWYQETREETENRNGFLWLGKVSRVLHILILNLGAGFLAKFWKGESFLRGYSRFLEQNPKNRRSLLSKWNIPFAHLDFCSKYL